MSLPSVRAPGAPEWFNIKMRLMSMPDGLRAIHETNAVRLQRVARTLRGYVLSRFRGTAFRLKRGFLAQLDAAW